GRAIDLVPVLVALVEAVQARLVAYRLAELEIVGFGINVERIAVVIEHGGARTTTTRVAEETDRQLARTAGEGGRLAILVERERIHCALLGQVDRRPLACGQDLAAVVDRELSKRTAYEKALSEESVCLILCTTHKHENRSSIATPIVIAINRPPDATL